MPSRLLALVMFAATVTASTAVSMSTNRPKAQPHVKQSNGVEYRNEIYNFCFALPPGWKGYSIVGSEWRGESGGKLIARGPILSIRHPRWRAKVPRQDIPIMVFTHDQWRLIQEEHMSVGAAPIGPGELGRNHDYVFALPARYNYAFPVGYQEVERILQKHPLQTPCGKKISTR